MIRLFTDDMALEARWRSMLGPPLLLQTYPVAALARLAADRNATCCVDLGQQSGADPGAVVECLRGGHCANVIALTAVPAAEEGLVLLRAGARGYCNRLASAGVIDAMLATIEDGRVWAGQEVNDYLLQAALASPEAAGAGDSEVLTRLTPKERQIAEQVGDGLSNKVIASNNGISERTVKAHLNSIFRKTGLRNRVQLAIAVTSGPDRSRIKTSHA